MTLVAATLALFAPIGIGFAAGAIRLFADAEAAIDPLNRYSLYIAFPALVAHGLLSSELALPSTPGFWLLVPVVLAITALLARATLPRQAPTLALILSFGNVAYLGLPVVAEAFGERALPLASLAVAVHVALALSVGPALLLRWSGSSPRLGPLLARVVRQPLLYAPLIGLALRLAPSSARAAIDSVLDPLGRSAAPVALFLLGLYIHVHRARMRSFDAGDLAHIAFKLLVMPALTFALAFALVRLGLLLPLGARVLFVLSAMPAAITTFAMAHEHGVGTARVSRAIVTTTLVGLVTVPASVWIALHAL